MNHLFHRLKRPVRVSLVLFTLIAAVMTASAEPAAWQAMPVNARVQTDASTTPAQSAASDDALSSPAISPVTLSAALLKTETIAVSLESTLKAVEGQNLAIQIQREGQRIDQARFYQSLTQFLPDIDGFYNYRRFKGVIQLFGNQTLNISQTTLEPGLSASVRVWPGGKTLFDAMAARRRVNASGSLVKETHQQQLARAASDYYTLLEAQLKRDFAQKSLEESKEQTAISQARFEAGLGTRLEVMQAQTAQSQRLRQLIEANNAIALAEQALLNRLNMDMDAHLVPTMTDAIAHRLVPESISPERLIENALKSHPALARLRQQRLAVKWQGRSVLSEAIPSVDLYANLSYRGPSADVLGLTRFAGFGVQTALGDKLGLSIPTRWLEAHRIVNQLELQSQQAVRDIEAQVASAFLDSQSAASAIEAVREEKRAAEESYRLAVGRYKAGVGINLDVISAESALSDARAQLVQAVSNFNRAQTRLVEAAGLASRQSLLEGLAADALTPATH
ncbi:MAG: TolC family protein [Vampirovibrionales bacterium]|nr:TolC family protein [Vampirovibrionales bacterium]